MQAEIVCSACGQRWQPTANDTHCPHCTAVVANERSSPPPIPGAISEGEPPFVLPVEEDVPQPRRVRPPRGWVALSITLALLGLSGGVDLWHASVEIDEALAVLNLLAGANAAALFTHAQALANRLAMAEIVLLVATTAAALNWVRIAYKNLRRLRVSGLSEPSALGWAGWFLPPGVFYVPPSRIQEIWRASDPAALPDPEAWKSSQGPWLIWLWWAFFLLRHIRINLNFAPLPVNDPAALKILLAAAWISAAACFLGVAAAALFSVIVVQIERRQWRRFDRLQD